MTSTASVLLVSVCVLVAGWLLAPTSELRLQHRETERPTATVAPPRWKALRGRLRSRRRTGTLALDVATGTTELAVLLRAGLGPAQAWDAVARQGKAGPGASNPWPVVAGAAAAAASEGRDVAAAVRAAAAAASLTGPSAVVVDRLAATWAVSQRTGAATAEVLQRYADTLRADTDAADAREAALAAPRATARVLVGLPPAGLLLGTVVGAEPLQVLLGTVPGRVSAAVGAACAVAGWVWTRRLLHRASRSGS